MQEGLNMVVAHRKANFLLWEDGLPALPAMTAEALSACSPSKQNCC